MLAISSDCDMEQSDDETRNRFNANGGASTDPKLGQLQNQRRLNLVRAAHVKLYMSARMSSGVPPPCGRVQ